MEANASGVSKTKPSNDKVGSDDQSTSLKQPQFQQQQPARYHKRSKVGSLGGNIGGRKVKVNFANVIGSGTSLANNSSAHYSAAADDYYSNQMSAILMAEPRARAAGTHANLSTDFKNLSQSSFFIQSLGSSSSPTFGKSRFTNMLKSSFSSAGMGVSQMGSPFQQQQMMMSTFGSTTSTKMSNKSMSSFVKAVARSEDSPEKRPNVGFTSFKDLLESQQNSNSSSINCNHFNKSYSIFYDKIASPQVELKAKIKAHLQHNSIQMDLIKGQLESDRYGSFEKNVLLKRHSDVVMSKSTSIVRKLVRNPNNEFAAEVGGAVGGKSQQQSQQQPAHLGESQSQINLKSVLDEHENELAEWNHSLVERAKFYWDKVVDYSSQGKPPFKESASLIEYQNRFLLFGGFGADISNQLYEYDMREYKWTSHELKGQYTPHEGRYGHSATRHKNTMILFGGAGEFNSRLKTRIVFNETWMLNLDTLEWKSHRNIGDYVEPRRNHAACVFGNNFLVHGGVNSHDKYINSMSILRLDKGKWKTLNLAGDENGIAFHQILPVFKKVIKSNLKRSSSNSKLSKSIPIKIKEEGLYCFGGKQGNERVRSQLFILKFDVQENPLEWVAADIRGKGPSPSGRFQHSMFTCSHLNCIGVFGGRSDGKLKDDVFSDVWLLNLENLHWVNIEVLGSLNRFRFAHAFTVVDERLFVFGGASNLAFTDSELYILEMDQGFVEQKRKNPIRDYLSRQRSLQRIEVKSNERSDLFDAQKNATNSQVRTFLRPPTKLQLQSRSNNKGELALSILPGLATSASQEFTSRSQTNQLLKGPRLSQQSLIGSP